jgi:hypothetical protein
MTEAGMIMRVTKSKFVIMQHIVIVGVICLLCVLLNWKAYHSPTKYFNPEIASEIPLPEIIYGIEVRQSITLPSTLKNLSGFSLLFATWGRTNNAGITVQILDPVEEIVQEYNFRAETLTDNSFVDFKLSEPYTEDNFTIIIKSDAVSGNGVTLWTSNSDSYDGGVLTTNGTETGGDVCFRLESKADLSESIFRFRYVVLILTILVLTGCYFSLFVLKKIFVRYMVIIFAVGFMYAVVMTPYSQPDCMVHVVNSEIVSNVLLSQNDKLNLIGTQFATGIGHHQTSMGYMSLLAVCRICGNAQEITKRDVSAIIAEIPRNEVL